MENENKTFETGTVNLKEITEAIKSIEILTYLYKRKRISTDNYIKNVQDNLYKLKIKRNYLDYLKNIGQ
jgi:hypothetical protein